ncbi:MAG: hypothetical protein M2R45_00292 [Verrucomicrobia subdivision 3 bacterium]|nr:hypothetical protein [Limisphaerales bacterium]MCS1412948.1 hypothetical protein [Limisphaerales bacterium]
MISRASVTIGRPVLVVIQKTTLLSCLILSGTGAVLADPKTQFNDANILYEQGEYLAAVNAYRQLIDGGTDSAVIRFNLGNALYQSSQIGHAIAQYYEALYRSPRDPDILANVQFAREKLGPNTSIPTNFWRQFLLQLTLNEWTLLALIPFWAWMACGACALLLTAKGGLLSTLSKLMGLAFLFTGILLLFAANERFGKQYAVVTSGEAVVRFGPFEESKSSHNLIDGVEVEILDDKEGWHQIRDPQQRVGWLQKSQIQRLQTQP